jgi:hypothetical protein
MAGRVRPLSRQLFRAGWNIGDLAYLYGVAYEVIEGIVLRRRRFRE